MSPVWSITPDRAVTNNRVATVVTPVAEPTTVTNDVVIPVDSGNINIGTTVSAIGTAIGVTAVGTPVGIGDVVSDNIPLGEEHFFTVPTHQEDESYSARQAIAAAELNTLRNLTDEDLVQWRTEFNRRTIELTPTESNSGTISLGEQIEFSEERNPRRWNIAKCSYNGSRYYLSYLVPPTATVDTHLEVVGGVHNGETPAVIEICVFNSEPYWRELRHLMHRQAEFLREMAAA